MQMTKKYFKTILAELIDENPVACRGVLRISELDFTIEVPTLAVTLSARPVLKVNLDFIAKNCHNPCLSLRILPWAINISKSQN